jgi:PAS domain S-box-containing protein
MNLTFRALISNLIRGSAGSADSETTKRLRALNLFLLILIITTLLLGLFYYLIGAVFLSYVTFIAALLGVAGIIILRKTNNLVASAHYAFFVLWATLLLIKWNTGGMSAGSLLLLSWIWNAALILMAIYIAGYLGGTIWTTMVFLETGVAIILSKSGYQFPNLLSPTISPVYSLASYLVGLLVILLIAFQYESERDAVIEGDGTKSQALAESKRYVDTIIEASPLPTFVINREHRVVQWNHAIQEMTGFSEQEVVGKNVHKSLYADEQRSLADILVDEPDSIAKRFAESIVSKTDSGAYQIETTLPAVRGGIQAIVTVAPVVDTGGSIKGAVEVIQDLTRLSGQKYTSHDNIEQAVEGSPSPVFTIDSNGKVSAWNRACENYLGYPFSQVAGKSPLTFVARPFRKSFRETVVRAFKGETCNGQEWKYYTAEGEARYVLANAYAIQASDGKSKQCVVVNTDVGDLKLRITKLERDETETREALKNMTNEYSLLRRNLATYIRGKGTGVFREEPEVDKLKKEMQELKKEIEDLKEEQ